MKIFEEIESEVRRYCRSFPAVFTQAEGYRITDENGKEYIDFFCGCGSLNYGHNNPAMKQKLLEYINENGIIQGLDMATVAKRNFLEQFREIILKKRNMDYKLQFPGPTGTNAVEAALKIARKITGRKNIAFFTNSFHGMTLGALSVSFNASKKYTDRGTSNCSPAMPFDGFFDNEYPSLEYIKGFLKISKTKSELPAAFILETVQCEGGVNIAGRGWLKELEKLLKKYEILLIIDDIQAGCGRTGTFFSFETSGIVPDIVCLSKSLSGYGLPLSLLLIKPELDVWHPGEHSGTFRGNNIAFVTATEALKTYWKNDEFSDSIQAKSKLIRQRLDDLVKKYPAIQGKVRGKGFVWGLESKASNLSAKVVKKAFLNRLLIEMAGPENNVLKLMPALITDENGLNSGLDILEQTFSSIC